MTMQLGGSIRCSVVVMLALCLSPIALAQPAVPGSSRPAAAENVVLPESVPDPLEPFNRAIWAFNQGLMAGIVKPTSKVYRWVVIKPIRSGIGNFGRNLTYPGRLINNLLQGKWRGARDESYRFVCNSTVGVGGFFDVGTRWKIPRSDADFGQTFGQWGWTPQCFLMLPLLGPSNERDLLGWAADTAAHPLLYIAPYEFEASDPLTYLGPYTYFSYGVMYNDLADTVREYVRFARAEMDAYADLQYAWTFARANRVADFQVNGEVDEASLDTLESALFTYQDPGFPDRGRTRSVRIPTTGRKLKFTFWLQPGKAPVVYLLPGLGAHRLAQPSLALAELLYRNGYSAVCLSSAFHAEFMAHASTAAMPAYLPVDARDVQRALTEIDRLLHGLYPDRLGNRALMGYSMGALQALFLAATESTPSLPPLHFDRYVALHTPVRLLHGVSRLDAFYRAPLDWPEGDRARHLDNTLLKVAALSKGTITPHASLPFSAIESKFLIGLTFRFMLRDIIFSSQQRYSQGVLRHSLGGRRRAPAYQEILQYSYQDYFEKLAMPYYQRQGLAAPAAEALEQAGDLRNYEAGLRANPDIRVIVNQNDFLLADEDLDWLRATFAPEQLTVFARGGHLGNLSDPAVQQGILGALAGLRSSPPTSDITAEQSPIAFNTDPGHHSAPAGDGSPQGLSRDVPSAAVAPLKPNGGQP
jgi:ABC-type transporter lipoprotein component MlaA